MPVHSSYRFKIQTRQAKRGSHQESTTIKQDDAHLNELLEFQKTNHLLWSHLWKMSIHGLNDKLNTTNRVLTFIALFIARRLVNTLIESVNPLNILIKQAPTVTKGYT